MSKEKCLLNIIASELEIKTLDEIVEALSEELDVWNKEDKEALRKKGVDIEKAEERVEKALANIDIPKDAMVELKNSIDDLVDQTAFEVGFYNRKYFKLGFKRGVQTIIECIKR